MFIPNQRYKSSAIRVINLNNLWGFNEKPIFVNSEFTR